MIFFLFCFRVKRKKKKKRLYSVNMYLYNSLYCIKKTIVGNLPWVQCVLSKVFILIFCPEKQREREQETPFYDVVRVL